jgi:hypothetical protein
LGLRIFESDQALSESRWLLILREVEAKRSKCGWLIKLWVISRPIDPVRALP